MTSALSGSGSPQQLYRVQAPEIMVKVETLQLSLRACDWKKATEQCIHLVDQGRALIARQLSDDGEFDPLPVTLDLLTALNSEKIVWQEETRYHIARATRLFLELACMKCHLDGRKIPKRLQDNCRGKIDEQISYSKDHVSLLYELKCCSEALKVMEEVSAKEYLITIFKAVCKPSFASVGVLMDILPDLIAKKNKDWFSEALFLNWMGQSARADRRLYDELINTLTTQIDTLEMAQTGLEFFADIIWHGKEELQWQALMGEIGLVSLVSKQKPSKASLNFMNTMWPVRYRAVQILSTLTSHPNPQIQQAATNALLDRRLQESDPRVKALLEAIEKQPAINQKWKIQFEKQMTELVEQNSREQESLDKREQELKEREQLLIAQTDQSTAEIEKQKQVLLQEKRYLEALRAENDARRENVYTLNMHFKEHVNQILDEVFAQNSPKMKRDEPPKYLCCPITLDLMQDPVIAADSYTYERSAIERHIREGGKSPMTNVPFANPNLTPNRAIKEAVELYLQENQGLPATPSPIPSPRVQTPARSAVEECKLAEDYILGRHGKPQNLDKGVEHIKTSAQKGNPVAQYYMGWLCDEQRGKEAAVKRSLEMEGKKGDLTRLIRYLLFDHIPSYGLRNGAEAVSWYRKAADQGYALAQNHLGWCYSYGMGVTKNHDHAVPWYYQAAQQGLAAAQDNMGVAYQFGKGVAKDLIQAASWYQKAAAQGHPHAQYSLGVCYQLGEGVPKEPSQAVAWLQKAADQDYASAQNRIGWCHHHGWGGIPKNHTEAAKWYKKAADQGNPEAAAALKTLGK